MVKQNLPKILRQLTPRRLIVPILLGLGVVGYLLWREFDPVAMKAVDWNATALFWLSMALLLFFVRDAAYVYRLRLLTEGKLSWRQAIQVIFIWEFASAATPSSAGGTPMAIYLLTKERISAGRSTAIVMLTIFIDELFFLIAVPLGFLLIGMETLVPANTAASELVNDTLLRGLQGWFIVGFSIIFFYTILLGYGLFVNPLSVKRLLHKLFSTRLLKRWHKAAITTGTDIIIASGELRKKNVWFWAKAIMATLISWSARLLVVNCILMIFGGELDHLLVYFRQTVMWIIALVSPTPGGSGFAEIAYSAFLGDYSPKGLMGGVVLLWRLFTYYPYLFIGIILLQFWISRKFLKSKKA